MLLLLAAWFTLGDSGDRAEPAARDTVAPLSLDPKSALPALDLAVPEAPIPEPDRHQSQPILDRERPAHPYSYASRASVV